MNCWYSGFNKSNVQEYPHVATFMPLSLRSMKILEESYSSNLTSHTHHQHHFHCNQQPKTHIIKSIDQSINQSINNHTNKTFPTKERRSSSR